MMLMLGQISSSFYKTWMKFAVWFGSGIIGWIHNLLAEYFGYWRIEMPAFLTKKQVYEWIMSGRRPSG
jgi:hypothetical protein